MNTTWSGDHPDSQSEEADVKASFVTFYKRCTLRLGSVPFYPAAHQLGELADTSIKASMALCTLAAYGQCGLSSLAGRLDALPALPASLEPESGPLPDILPMQPLMVQQWVRVKAANHSSCRRKRLGLQVCGMINALIFCFAQDTAVVQSYPIVCDRCLDDNTSC